MAKRSVPVLVAVLICMVSVSCVSKMSQVVTDVKADGGQRIEAKAGGVGVLSLTVPKLIGKAEERLLAQCQGKTISNTNSSLSMRNFFIVQYYVIKISGTCSAS